MTTRGSVILIMLTILFLGGCDLMKPGLLGMRVTEECLKEGFKTVSTVQKLMALPGEKLVIVNKVGSLTIKSWEGTEIRLLAEKKAKGFPPEELGIEVSRRPGELKVRTKTPWWLDCQRAFAVDLFLLVPKSLDIEANLIFGLGGVKLEGGFTGRIQVLLDEGDIQVRVPPEASLIIRAEIGTEGEIETSGLGENVILLDRTGMGIEDEDSVQAIEAVLGKEEGYLYVRTEDGTISLGVQTESHK